MGGSNSYIYFQIKFCFALFFGLFPIHICFSTRSKRWVRYWVQAAAAA